MKKKMAALIATLVMMVGVLFATATPASAAGTGCVSIQIYSGVYTCVNIEWQNQNVKLTSIEHLTTAGCSKLESSGGRYEYLDLSTSNKYYHWTGQACSGFKTISDSGGSGTTSRVVNVYMKARVNWDSDQTAHWRFTLRSNGTYSVETSRSWQPGE